MCLIYDVNPAFIHDTIRPKTVSVHLASFNDSNMFLFRRIQPMHFAAAGEGSRVIPAPLSAAVSAEVLQMKRP